MHIALISCSKTKSNTRTKAMHMYQGNLFLKSLMFCFRYNIKTYILLAKYGLLDLEDVIDPYEDTLNNKSKLERLEWSDRVNASLVSLGISEAIIFAGKRYHEFLNIKKILPLEGLRLGQQLKWFNDKEKTYEKR